MYSKLKVFGNASQKLILEIELSNKEIELSLMDFLREKNIPVASSCLGEGVCGKCSLKLNGDSVLSCQVKLESVTKNMNTIKIDYL